MNGLPESERSEVGLRPCKNVGSPLNSKTHEHDKMFKISQVITQYFFSLQQYQKKDTSNRRTVTDGGIKGECIIEGLLQ